MNNPDVTDHQSPPAASTPATGSAHNSLTLKWGTLKGWDVKTPEAVALLKTYHSEPVSYSVMMQRDTAKQKETIIALIEISDEIWLDWEGKKVSRDEAKKYVLTYGLNGDYPTIG